MPVDCCWWSGHFFVYGCAGCWVWGLLCPSTSAAGAVTVGAGAGGLPAPATSIIKEDDPVLLAAGF